jgi:hypothetical protein
MAEGLDLFKACTDATVQCFKQGGYRFVGRYYFNLTKTIKEKFTRDEALRICAAGMQLVAVYENASNQYSYFTAAKGASDAAGALQQAADLGQPEGSVIYFTVDYDASEDEIDANITDYFKAVNEGIDGRYEIGVYGSGLTCTKMLDAELATYAWLSCSSGWNGSKTFTRWNIKQAVETQICGLDCDPDQSIDGDFGAFVVA